VILEPWFSQFQFRRDTIKKVKKKWSFQVLFEVSEAEARTERFSALHNLQAIVTKVYDHKQIIDGS
jgi:DNA-binding HxlR family transcriptional regulator